MNCSLRQLFRHICRSLVILTLFLLGSAPACPAQKWHYVGSPGFSRGEPMFPNIAIDRFNNVYVAFSDFSMSFLPVVMKYNGSYWDTVGVPGFAGSNIGQISLALDAGGTPYVVFPVGDFHAKATAMKFDGANWVVLGGSGFSIDTVNAVSITIDRSGIPFVVYDDEMGGLSGEGRATVKKFVDGTWVTVGMPVFSPQSIFGPTIVTDTSGTPYVVFIDGLPGAPVTVMKFNGSSWVQLGPAVPSAGFVYPPGIALDAGGTPYVIFTDGPGEKATVIRYNGTGWDTVGNSQFSPHAVRHTSIAIDKSGTPVVAFQDYDVTTPRQEQTLVMKYNGTGWTTEGIGGVLCGAPVMALDTNGLPFLFFADFSNNEEYLARGSVMRQMPDDAVTGPASPADWVAVQPNPGNGSFLMRFPDLHGSRARMLVTTVSGIIVKNVDITGMLDLMLDLDGPAGLYFVSILTDQGRQTIKLVKE